MLAVITGASSGLGKEFAKQLDSLGCDTVIVARREDRLNELKSQLRGFLCRFVGLAKMP